MSAIPFQAPDTGWRRVSHRPRNGRTGGLFGRTLSALRDWRRRRRNRNELAALDDRTLRDIGLSRSDALYLSSTQGDDDASLDTLRFPPF
jgi:uncharacterized protein YjiS (DUF1127 family)